MDSTVLVGALLNDFCCFGHYAQVGITLHSSLELLAFVLATYCFRYPATLLTSKLLLISCYNLK